VSSATTGATGLSGRYASALFELADSDSQLDVVAADLRQLDGMIGENADLARMIRSPVFTRAEQGGAIGAVMEKASMGDLTRRFVGVVADNRRLFVLPAIIKSFLSILATHRGEVTAEVLSAQALNDSQVSAVEAALKKAVGSNVTIDAKVDPGVLGGLVVRMGSRMVDSSLRTKLQRLRLAMRGVG
jgi:F-type H+-transporting ATPase subunit delta